MMREYTVAHYRSPGHWSYGDADEHMDAVRRAMGVLRRSRGRVRIYVNGRLRWQRGTTACPKAPR
jgi:hypothetical protein